MASILEIESVLPKLTQHVSALGIDATVGITTSRGELVLCILPKAVVPANVKLPTEMDGVRILTVILHHAENHH